ncbi:hypothetical protein [Dyella sp. Tek66A03]|uniref:hypothetical protein n=1 Tax=Dyella sp. Tek66A03 TaxID=3458298 RepID=UPI00403EEA5B
MARDKQKTPAQAQRSKLMVAIRARGEQGTNIWVVRPPFQSKDLILNSDPQFEAFYLLEGEPSFREVNYLPQWYEVQAEGLPWQPTKPFAVVTTLDGHELRVDLAFDSPSPAGGFAAPIAPNVGIVVVNLHVLNKYIQRVENWRRVIPCIRRARLHGTAAIERQILVMLHRVERATLRSLYANFGDDNAGIFFGAIAMLLRKRELCSDLDTRPWSMHTCVWSAEA